MNLKLIFRESQQGQRGSMCLMLFIRHLWKLMKKALRLLLQQVWLWWPPRDWWWIPSFVLITHFCLWFAIRSQMQFWSWAHVEATIKHLAKQCMTKQRSRNNTATYTGFTVILFYFMPLFCWPRQFFQRFFFLIYWVDGAESRVIFDILS